MDWPALGQAAAALVLAALLGGLIGIEREAKGRWAGLRTHMMVSLGSCLFVLTGLLATTTQSGDLTRVIQGIAAGVGFIGAGTIIKLTDRMEILGLTTASTIWMAAAVGTACGANFYGPAVIGTLTAVTILIIFRRIELWMNYGAIQALEEPTPPKKSGKKKAENEAQD